MRVAFGGYMAAHGWPKVVKLVSGDHAWVDPLGIGESASLAATAFGEFLCPLFVIVGLFTRAATVPVMLTMLVGLLFQHGSDPWILWHDPINNAGGGLSKEQPILYFAAFLTVFLLGPGRISIDAKLAKGKAAGK